MDPRLFYCEALNEAEKAEKPEAKSTPQISTNKRRYEFHDICNGKGVGSSRH
jgi:hypothetical protein